jgi:ribosomal protein S18 acetylase RimI-like enzyme
MITILPVTEEHLSLLQDIGSRSLLQSHGHSAPAEVMQAYVDEKFTEEALAAELADSNSRFHLIFHEGQPAGYSKIVLHQPIPSLGSQPLTKLERLYLLEAFLGLQLGLPLLQFNMELSRQEGDRGMWLYVWKENRRAIRFYEKAGFRIVGDGLFRLTADHANPNWQMALEYGEVR